MSTRRKQTCFLDDIICSTWRCHYWRLCLQ